MMKFVAVFILMASVVIGADFQHTLSGTKPWTSEEFLGGPQEFHFAVLPDRTGACSVRRWTPSISFGPRS